MADIMNDSYPKYPIRENVAELKDGDKLLVDNNTVMHNKHASFFCELPEGGLSDDARIQVGHGWNCYSAAFVEVSATHVRVYHYYQKLEVSAEFEHGLDISDYLSVVIDVKISKAVITVATAGGVFKTDNVSWAGRQGAVFASPVGLDIKDVKLNWSCEDYAKDIWLFGDSYFNCLDPHRWPSYMCKDGFVNHFMTGYPGMAAQRAIVDFRLALTRGKPKFAVWCMGMNNGDKDGVINENYLAATAEFLDLCRFNGITPILSTIPTTPNVDNRPKNEWVLSQGVRYIDFARAVGGHAPTEGTLGKKYTLPSGSAEENITGFEWYKDMLYPDLVHPAPLGANTLYVQVLVDFPEIMNR